MLRVIGVGEGPASRGRIRQRGVTLDDWDDTLILQFVDIFAASRSGDAPIASGRYAEVYGERGRPLVAPVKYEEAKPRDGTFRDIGYLFGKPPF